MRGFQKMGTGHGVWGGVSVEGTVSGGCARAKSRIFAPPLGGAERGVKGYIHNRWRER
jgi:hypothetical protein